MGKGIRVCVEEPRQGFPYINKTNIQFEVEVEALMKKSHSYLSRTEEGEQMTGAVSRNSSQPFLWILSYCPMKEREAERLFLLVSASFRCTNTVARKGYVLQ